MLMPRKKQQSRQLERKKKKVNVSALGLGEEDAKSPGDSESFSARRPQKHVDHFSDAADRRGKYILIGEVEELHLHDIRERASEA